MARDSVTGSAGSRPSLRDRTSRALRAEVTAVAMELFLEQGFAKTTVEQIAAEAGLSRTSFFRYFATKEDVALGNLDELGRVLHDVLAERPEDEPAWQALQHALATYLDHSPVPQRREQRLKLALMTADEPSLMSRYLQKRLSWYPLLVPEIARRMAVPDSGGDVRPRALVASALACYDAAVSAWAANGGTIELAEMLREAMAGVAAEAVRTSRT